MKKIILKYFINLVFFTSITAFSQSDRVYKEIEKTAIQLVQGQLEAYNNRDIETFLSNYSETVKIFYFPNKLAYEGIENMRKEYEEMFKSTPDLHCKIVNRIVNGNKVIDHESVIFSKNKPSFSAIAIYIIENNKIQEVYFLN